MTKAHIVSRRVSAALALILLMPPLIFFIMWSSISAKVTGISAEEQMTIYMGYFPAWLKNITTIHTISIVCCVLVIILAVRSFSKNLISVRVLMMITVLVAAFIILFDIYQMV